MRINDWSSDVCSSDLPGDRLAERGLAAAQRADEAEDRALHLLHALLHGEVFEDALLHLLEAVVVGVENLLRVLDVALHLGALLPGDREDPVEVVANYSSLDRKSVV